MVFLCFTAMVKVLLLPNEFQQVLGGNFATWKFVYNVYGKVKLLWQFNIKTYVYQSGYKSYSKHVSIFF